MLAPVGCQAGQSDWSHEREVHHCKRNGEPDALIQPSANTADREKTYQLSGHPRTDIPVMDVLAHEAVDLVKHQTPPRRFQRPM